MFFYNLKKKRTLQKLMEKHDGHFGFIERVILSCNTLEQLKNAWKWARGYCSQNRDFEQIGVGFDEYFAVSNYFNRKREVINEQYFRKQKELLELKYGKNLGAGKNALELFEKSVQGMWD